MAIDVGATAANPQVSAANANRAADGRERDSTEIALQRNVDQASFGVRDQPQELLYRTAVQAVNEQLGAEFNSDAQQAQFEAPTPPANEAPEQTANRIVDEATTQFPAYQEQNPELDETQQRDQFVQEVEQGVERGFAEARDILEGIDAGNEEVTTNIDRTFELVQQGLADFQGRNQPAAEA